MVTTKSGNRLSKGRGGSHARQNTTFRIPWPARALPPKYDSPYASLGTEADRVPAVGTKTLGVVATNIRRLIDMGLVSGETEWAKRAQVPLTTITSLTQGKVREPSVETARKLAGGLGLDIRELVEPYVPDNEIDRIIEEFRKTPDAALLTPPLGPADVLPLRQTLRERRREEPPTPRALYWAVIAARELAGTAR